MKDNSRTIVALIAGLATGAALGLLLAPASGGETTDKLANALKNLKNKVLDGAGEEIRKLNGFKGELQSEAKEKLTSKKNEIKEVLTDKIAEA